ncbi:MAG TPA: anti-sigma regulatory factor [Candidatus Polarisedimenticolia bacterium]|nr:anti-sigma regulatory factor [Candidatus Polarisedimenticolia bacterium]
MKGQECVVPIESDTDIVVARQQGRAIGHEVGFSPGDLAMIATAISELARNIVTYAERGEIAVRILVEGSRRGIVVVSRDQGPGIRDIPQAMRDGHSTSGGLGLGLPGVKRLMDDFEIDSAPGRGTRVTIRKWMR